MRFTPSSPLVCAERGHIGSVSGRGGVDSVSGGYLGEERGEGGGGVVLRAVKLDAAVAPRDELEVDDVRHLHGKGGPRCPKVTNNGIMRLKTR